MALVTEDGTGLATAESYVSVADADTYFTAQGNTAWTGADALKEVALRKAATFLDATYRYRGSRYTMEQGLDWPRVSVEWKDGFWLDDLDMPQALKDANCEGAVRALTAQLDPDIAKPGKIREEIVGAGQGAVDKKVVYAGGGRSQIKEYRRIALLLKHLTLPPRGGVKLVRV